MRRWHGWLGGLAVSLIAATALADEGLWPLEHAPRDLLASRRGVTLDDAWLNRAQLASVDLGNACSAIFVSGKGLLITSRACAESCLTENTTLGSNLAEDGFTSRSPIEEKRCRRLQGRILVATEDISGQIALATAGLDAAAAASARDRELQRLEQACQEPADPKAERLDCVPVVFYGGGEYRLYKFRALDDIRLTFAPERGAARIAGAAYEFPRLAFDVALLRAYADGKPVDAPVFLRVNFAGAAERESVLVVGHPAPTARSTTLAELLTTRDTTLESELLEATELRGRFVQFSLTNAQAREHVAQPLVQLERELTERRALFDALLGEPQVAARRAAEDAFRARIASDAELRLSAGGAFDEIAAAQNAARPLAERRHLVDSVGRRSNLVGFARLIVRASLERQKPDAERRPEFRNAALPATERQLAVTEPFAVDIESLQLAFALGRLKERLGATDPLVGRLLGSEPSAAIAERAVSRTRVGDPAFRAQLWSAGAGAVVTSDDPLIALARELEAATDALDAEWRPAVEAPMQRANEKLARARLRFADAASYPDATGTLRISSGIAQGFTESGRAVPVLTTLSQALDAPAAPARWTAAKDRLTGATTLNIQIDDDIGSGCDGCAVLGNAGDLLGIVIGGNRAAAAGRYVYDPASTRAVTLSAAALKEILLKVYRTDDLMKEMVIAR